MDAGIKAIYDLTIYDLLILTEYFLQCRAITDIRLHERDLVHADDLSHALQRLGIGVIEVIYHYCGMSRTVEFYQGMGADESGSAGYKNLHDYE